MNTAPFETLEKQKGALSNKLSYRASSYDNLTQNQLVKQKETKSIKSF